MSAPQIFSGMLWSKEALNEAEKLLEREAAARASALKDPSQIPQIRAALAVDCEFYEFAKRDLDLLASYSTPKAFGLLLHKWPYLYHAVWLPSLLGTGSCGSIAGVLIRSGDRTTRALIEVGTILVALPITMIFSLWVCRVVLSYLERRARRWAARSLLLYELECLVRTRS